MILTWPEVCHEGLLLNSVNYGSFCYVMTLNFQLRPYRFTDNFVCGKFICSVLCFSSNFRFI